jgi:ferredoxin-thioredoxin reductase catalytic chain
MNEAEKLYETLKKIQEPKGYFFNPDKTRVFEVLEGLLENKARFGYMSCPCRLAMSDRETDSDIICPCKYRAQDVAEFGSCYCLLYVSPDVAKGEKTPEFVPERRVPRF